MEGRPRDLNCRHCSYRFWRRGGLLGCWRNLRRLQKETQLTGNYSLQQLVNSVELGMFTVMLVRWPVCCKMQRLYQGLNQCTASLGFPGGSVVKNPPAKAGAMSLIPGTGRSPGEGNVYPLQHSCLGNPSDREPGGLQSMGSQRAGHA